MFKLNFEIPASSAKINLSDPVLLIGSCFSDEIGEKLKSHKFNAFSNPFGTIYNPHSIFKVLEGGLNPKDTIESQGVYYHWDAHGSVSGLSETDVSALLVQKNQEMNTFLGNAKWLIIALGTAIVYEYENVGIVANCHKIPQSKFTKRFLSQKEIIGQFARLHAKFNPNLKIIFTVSPVRHIRDGLVENNRSKAILLDSIHQLVEEYKNVHYFPAYEILIDELRDYRFYAEDMIHPSSQAINYIWDTFSQTYFDSNTRSFLSEWVKVKAALNHRSFQPQSVSHQKFLYNTLEKLTALNEKVDLRVEIEQVKNQLK
ncbi:MAG: GSCFA domain-containing protein [Ekhidna sp.]|uniref:GSCFA domain-containing protein n=1 Tax=Ekhidna sp. TaxID=2608089 RepID=UPI0032ED23AD